MALIAFTSFLLSRRIPPEALFMRRARDEGGISEFVHQSEKALIGTRRCAGADCLIVRMSWRKNLARGRILKRACICTDNSHQARKMRPPLLILPLLRQL